MTLRFSLPREQVFSDAGTPLPGAKLYFYAAGTSTPKLTYSDAALTIPHANPVVADAGGRFGDIFLDTGSYKVVLQTAAGVQVWAADPVEGASAGAGAAGANGTRNLLINSDFRINQRGVTTAADDTYCLDRWYALAQSGSVTVAQQFAPEVGQYACAHLTQPDAAAKRIGLAQIVETADAILCAGAAATLAGRIRCSVSQAIRYALLSWTYPAFDAVTSDIVNDWTAANYVPGGFFLGSSLVVTAIGSVTPAANVWTDLPPITGVLPGGMANLIVLVWTEGTLAQNATLDLGLMRLAAGADDPGFTSRPAAEELALCQRYYEAGAFALGGMGTASISYYYKQPFKATKRAVPTVSYVETGSTNASTRDVRDPTIDSLRVFCVTPASLGYAWEGTWTADAEL